MARASSPFASGRAPRAVALTSLDEYFADAPAEPRDALSPSNSAPEDPYQTIASLQRERQHLSEEIASERHRSESLKATFTQALAEAVDRQKQGTAKLRAILEGDRSDGAVRALAFLGDAAPAASPGAPDSSRMTELARQAKAAQQSVAAQKAENERLKDQVHAMMAARDERAQHLQELKAAIDAATARRSELKEKLRALAARYKASEAEWKKKIAALDAELEDRGES
jgi:chromosome segregation ATPase